MHIVQGEMDLMDLAYNEAKTKAIRVANEKGRSKRPWLEYPEEFLTMRLENEIDEWHENEDSDELLDIIDFAIFLYLKKKGWNDHKLEEIEPVVAKPAGPEKGTRFKVRKR